MKIELTTKERAKLTSLGKMITKFYDVPKSTPEQLAEALLRAGMKELDRDKGGEWVEADLREVTGETSG